MRARQTIEGALGRIRRPLIVSLLLACATAQAQPADPCALPQDFTVNYQGQLSLGPIECELRVDGSNVESACKGGGLQLSITWARVARQCAAAAPGRPSAVTLAGPGHVLFVVGGRVVGIDSPSPLNLQPPRFVAQRVSMQLGIPGGPSPLAPAPSAPPGPREQVQLKLNLARQARQAAATRLQQLATAPASESQQQQLQAALQETQRLAGEERALQQQLDSLAPPPSAPPLAPPPGAAVPPSPAPTPAAVAAPAQRVAQQPEGAPEEGELYYGRLPGDGIFYGEETTPIGKCRGRCLGYKNAFSGAFVNLDWEIELGASRAQPVIGVWVRLDNGRHGPVRAFFSPVLTGRNGVCGGGPIASVDAPARAESHMDLFIGCRSQDRNTPTDVQLLLNNLQLFERQKRGWVRLR